MAMPSLVRSDLIRSDIVPSGLGPEDGLELPAACQRFARIGSFRT